MDGQSFLFLTGQCATHLDHPAGGPELQLAGMDQGVLFQHDAQRVCNFVVGVLFRGHDPQLVVHILATVSPPHQHFGKSAMGQTFHLATEGDIARLDADGQTFLRTPPVTQGIAVTAGPDIQAVVIEHRFTQQGLGEILLEIEIRAGVIRLEPKLIGDSPVAVQRAHSRILRRALAGNIGNCSFQDNLIIFDIDINIRAVGIDAIVVLQCRLDLLHDQLCLLQFHMPVSGLWLRKYDDIRAPSGFSASIVSMSSHAMAQRQETDSMELVDASALVKKLLARERRLLLFGAPGIGKSTLAAWLARTLEQQGRSCHCLSADPGSPAFGVPGAITLGHWQAGAWQVGDIEALCTLDAGRFRLPVTLAVQRLGASVEHGILLVDGPGVVRGVAGRELLHGLVEAARIDSLLVLFAAGGEPPLGDELRALPVDIFGIEADFRALRPGKQRRARQRTAQWDGYLGHGRQRSVDSRALNLIGLPPPVDITDPWIGRQVGLLKAGQTLALAEVTDFEGEQLTLRGPLPKSPFDTLLVRDARRNPAGLLETTEPFAREPLRYLPPANMTQPLVESGGPRVAGRAGRLDVMLVNGVFGDPLLHLRLRHQARSLLIDLGEGTRLAARTAHQISDVFISHAHMDHIAAFPWLLRSRLVDLPPCRLYGPPGLAHHIQGFVHGFLWDRIGDRGPVFELHEVYPDHMKRFRLKVGFEMEPLPDLPLENGVLLSEKGLRVRAARLDHLHTDVLAFAIEQTAQINIRKDRLQQRQLEPGPWLTELKQQLLANNPAAPIRLPDGKTATAGELGKQLTLTTPGKKLVYATDLADTGTNREQLIELARHAHTFFCEAPFLQGDADRARLTGHLTTRACGEIAAAADVVRLVPFHFSRRYADDPQPIYEEIGTVCNQLVIPRETGLFTVTASNPES